MLNFAKPVAGDEQATLSLSVRNVGTGDLIIAGVRVEEDDEVSEISVLDGEDWSSRTIQPAGWSETTSPRHPRR